MAARTYYADERSGFLYLVRCGSIFKIGFTDCPERRAAQLRKLQSSCYYPFVAEQIRIGYLPEMIHAFPVSQMRRSERAMHNRFMAKRLHWPENWQGSGATSHLTEWFQLSDEDVDWFCSIENEGQLQ